MSQQAQINAFGVIVKEKWREPYIDDIKKTHIFKYGLKLEKETGTTKPIIAEEIDTDQLIQSYKDTCGLEAAQKMIRSGLASPEQFADDGKHSGDLTGVPDYAGDLVRQVQQSNAAAAQVKSALGIENLDGDIEKIVTEAVNKKIAEIQAQSQEGDKKGE